MIVIGFIMIVMSMRVANIMLVRMHVGMRGCVIVIASLAGFVIVATRHAMDVFGRRDGKLGRRACVNAVLVFVMLMVVSVIVIVVVMMPGDEIRIARLPPENGAAGEGE